MPFTYWFFIFFQCSNATNQTQILKSEDIGIYKDSIPKGWAEINMGYTVINKMAYADTANFMHRKIYPCARCFLRPEVASAFEDAVQIASAKDVKLVVYDCYRPYQFQYKMYEIVNNPRYVAKPVKGSNHNRGQAVDVALADSCGNLLDMGNNFDDFSEKSHYASKSISKEGRANRKLLRSIMVAAGFSPYDNEWWHFDYKVVQYPVANFVWDCNE